MERLRLPVGVAVPPVRQAFDSWPLRSRRSPENAVVRYTINTRRASQIISTNTSTVLPKYEVNELNIRISKE